MESRTSQFRIIASRPLPEGNREPTAKESHDPPRIRLFVPPIPRRESGRSRALRIGRFILRGGGPLHELPLIDVSLKRTCLMFPPGTHLAAGEIFEIVRPIRILGDLTRRLQSPRKVVALVKVIGIEGETRALVRVLKGSVIKGYWAERIEEDRIAALLHCALNIPDFFSILRSKPHEGR